MRRFRLCPITEFAAGVSVIGALIVWSYGGPGLLDAITGRPPADERLIAAAATLDHQAFDAALADGASAKAYDPMGMTALGYAAIVGDEARVERLITAGAEVDGANRWGITPLMFAAEFDKPTIVEMLLRHGADIGRRGLDGKTAADRARSREAHLTVKVLTKWSSARSAASPPLVAQSDIYDAL